MFQEVPQLLTEQAAADRLGISLSTLRRWRRQGASPSFFRCGATLRYSIDAIEAFIRQHTVEAR